MELSNADEWGSGFQYDDDDEVPASTRGDVRCDGCTSPDVWRELVPLASGRSEMLCERCVALRVTGAISPVDAFRAYLERLPLAERAKRALIVADVVRSEAKDIRQQAAAQLHRQLRSWTLVGREIGVTPARAANLAAGRDERARARRVRAGAVTADRSQLAQDDATPVAEQHFHS
ncbi:MAG: hypothetical protein M0014_02780 [Actinomycetota bacterium]|nr:hypothetical protein [Actinomycetota bacterium]